MATLDISPVAIADQRSILSYLLAEAGIRIAERYEADFNRCTELLVKHPQSGPLRPLFGQGIRISVVNPYIIIYRYILARTQFASLEL